MKEHKICQKCRQDSGPLRDFSLSCVIPRAIMVIQTSRALLYSRRISLSSLRKPIQRPGLEWRGHPDSEVTEGGGLQKIFSAVRASFCSKNNGGRAPGPPPLDPPLNCYYSPSGLLHGRASPLSSRACKEHAHPRDNPEGLLIFHHSLLRFSTKE